MLSVDVFVIWAAEISGKEKKKNQLTNQQIQQQEIFKWHILHLKPFKIQFTRRKKIQYIAIHGEIINSKWVEYYVPAI